MVEDVDDSDVDDSFLHIAFIAQIITNPINIITHAHLEYAEVCKISKRFIK